MNVFTTEHPMASQSVRTHPRFRWWLLGSLLVYPVWLVMLGPFWALDGRGAIDFLPLNVRRIVYLPAAPLFYIDSLSTPFERYMKCWYEDPDAPETTR